MLAVGSVSVRYYVVRKGRGYWITTPTMRAAGFPGSVPCGKDGPDAWRIAETWNSRWDEHRSGKVGYQAVFPGSLAEAFARFRRTETWASKAPKTRLEWERAWRDIEPIFGDVDPATVVYDHVDAWYADLLQTTRVDRAWRAMKIWRALWGIAAAMHFTRGKTDPSLKVRRKSQPKRSHRWSEGEVVRLVKHAWRVGSRGLACIQAVAWDSQLSPGDVRLLSHRKLTELGFWTTRGKTGKATLGTLSKRTRALLSAYLANLPFHIPTDTPMFRARNGQAFTDQTLSKAFARNRQKLFPNDPRTLMDMRRSGAVEANAGGVDPGALGAKMANSYATARDLQATYTPVDPVTVARADEARRRGRTALRGVSTRTKP
jgi:hypothetical protein